MLHVLRGSDMADIFPFSLRYGLETQDPQNLYLIRGEYALVRPQV